MSIALCRLPELTADDRLWFITLVVEALTRGRWRGRRLAEACIVWTSEGLRVTSRADFASWLAANALPELAREVANRRRSIDETIIYCDADVPGFAGVSVFAVDLAKELAALRAERFTTTAGHAPEKEPSRWKPT